MECRHGPYSRHLTADDDHENVNLKPAESLLSDALIWVVLGKEILDKLAEAEEIDRD